MEIRTLRYFLAVAREENMTRAAEVLHVTQPTLSKALKTLEEELGKKLFIRHSFSIRLTEEGVLLSEQGINGCFAHLCVCRWEFPSPFSHIRVAARFIETLPLSPCGPSEKQKDEAGHQEVF